MEIMISVIVPFYNSEATLRRCIESIINQSYRNLDILLVNDGSTDNSGSIADEYKADSRIRVFHKENEGLSSARNYGLDLAMGDYIAFVDADDWIEKSAFEIALSYNADICIFGYLEEWPEKTNKKSPVQEETMINSEEAIKWLIVDGYLVNGAWDKLYKRYLFEGVRYPVGYNYEDLRTTYKLLQKTDSIMVIPNILYHYMQYNGSISHYATAENELDRWTAYYEQYCVFSDKGEDYKKMCTRRCNNAIITSWGSLWKAKKEVLLEEQDRITEIVSFARKNNFDSSKLYLKLGVALAAKGTRWSMFFEYLLVSIYRLLHYQKLFSTRY